MSLKGHYSVSLFNIFKGLLHICLIMYVSQTKTFTNQLFQLCTDHSVFDIGLCMVIHCDAGGMTNEKQRKTDILLTNQ